MKREVLRILVAIDTDADANDEVTDILNSGAVAESCSIAEVGISEDSVGADLAFEIVKS